VTQKPDPVGNPSLVYTTQAARDANGNVIHVTQANSVVTDYAYDELDRMVSYATHPTAQTTLTTGFTLDGNGAALTRTTPQPENEVVTNTYDTMSRLITVTATNLSPISYQYDASGNRTQMTDGTGTTTYQYDGLGRLLQAVQPGGTLGYAYDPNGNRTSLVYPAGADTVTYVYTKGDRLDHLQDGAGRTSTYAYAASGLVTSLSAPDGLLTTYAYDRAQRLTSTANLVGASVRTRHSYTLDREGNRLALDEFVEGITATPSTTWAASTKVNSDTGTAVQDHPQIALGGDGAHYLIWDDTRDGNANIYFSKRDPVSGAWSTPSTKVNTDTGTRIQLNPAIALDGASNAYAVWQDERNGAGKPDIFFRKRTAADQTWVSPDVKVSDETGGGGGSVQRNPRIAGTAAGMETAVWVDLRSSQNNIYSARTTVPGATTWAANVKVTDNTASVKDFPDVTVGLDGTAYAVWQDRRNGNDDIYFSKLLPGAPAWTANVKVSDDPGSATQRLPRVGADATGNVTVVWLDDRTTPSKIRMSRLPAGSSTWPASTVVADAAARPVSVALSVRPDGKAYVVFGDNRIANTDIYGSEYDPWLDTWTTSTLTSDDPGSAGQQNPTIAFGITENAAAWRDDRPGNADVRARRASLTGTEHLGMTYDGLERLVTVVGTNPESFVFDAGSNIASRTGPTAANTYDSANRLTSDGSQPYAWSPSDRLQTRGADTFSFDPLNRMTASSIGGTTRTYAYNGDGLLQSRTQGASVNLLWDPETSPSRLLKAGGDRIIYGLGPIYAVKADGTTVTFARDGGKSVRAELSSSGALTSSFRYRAYGQTAQTFGASAPAYLGYAGQLLDPSGMYYMRARWYDPASARFVSRDPVIGASPAGLNAFAYASGNPALLSDPTGMCPECAGGVAVAAVAYVAFAPVTIPATVLIAGAGLVLFGIGALIIWQATENNGSKAQDAVTSGGTANPPAPGHDPGKRGNKARQEGLSVDQTGKVHGPLPTVAELKNMTRQALEDTRDALTESINTRADELFERGEHAGHRARLGAEETLLRSLEKILGDLPSGE
jgi:RHS repeat-associated protein